MGHERVGVLPRSKQWRQIVEALDAAASSDADTLTLANATLENVRKQFAQIQLDSGVQAAFGFLIGLSTRAEPREGALSTPPLNLEENPSPVGLASQLSDWVHQHADSLEYAELAKRAAGDAIATWTRLQSSQHELFSDSSTAEVIWSKAANGAAFSEITRVFFAKLVERYLNYFLEREASASIRSLERREEFNRRLTQQIHVVSEHAFETSKITQSFAAGWFNKNVREERPSDRSLKAFLAFTFGKVRAELRREATS